MAAGCDPVGNPRSGRRDHRRLEWDETLEGLVARLLPTWLGEDLGYECDWTSIALVPDRARAELNVVARTPGVVAGLRGAGIVAAGADPAAAVRRARDFVARTFPPERAEATVVEIELDTLDHLPAVLEAGADIILLDNMPAEQLAVGVEIRNRLRPEVILEASGGISPDTVRNIAASGIDRVSSGWPTHAAPWLDVALDWAAATRSA